MNHWPRLSILLLALFAATPSRAADPLPRRAWIGVQWTPVPDAADLRVDAIRPGGTAEALGMRQGDVVPDGDARRLWTDPGAAPVGGAPVALPVKRAGKPIVLRARAVARPFETFAHAQVHYGAVPFGDGALRDILVTPDGVANPPVVFMVQGFPCGSIEGGNIYHQIGDALLRAGFAYYRVEKPGVGDSRGSDVCTRIDFRREMEGFRAAYRHLPELGFARDRTFLFGVSLGGVQVPLLAAEEAPRGVAVWGTIVRNWGDYWHDLDVYQGFWLSGLDPVEEAHKAERNREALRLYFGEGQSPRAIAAAHPDWVAGMTDSLNWDGGDLVSGRDYRFFQQLAKTDLFEAWAKTRAPVLSLYGGSDVIALTDVDQKLIADIANHYRPGSGSFRVIADTDHQMRQVGPREVLREKARAGGQADGPFNQGVIAALAEWMRSVLAQPARTG